MSGGETNFMSGGKQCLLVKTNYQSQNKNLILSLLYSFFLSCLTVQVIFLCSILTAHLQFNPKHLVIKQKTTKEQKLNKLI